MRSATHSEQNGMMREAKHAIRDAMLLRHISMLICFAAFTIWRVFAEARLCCCFELLLL